MFNLDDVVVHKPSGLKGVIDHHANDRGTYRLLIEVPAEELEFPIVREPIIPGMYKLTERDNSKSIFALLRFDNTWLRPGIETLFHWETFGEIIEARFLGD